MAGVDDIEGVVRVRFKLLGVTEVSSSTSLLLLDVLKRLDVDWLRSGVRGTGDTGMVWSSVEYIDKSSPFHWSPR